MLNIPMRLTCNKLSELKSCLLCVNRDIRNGSLRCKYGTFIPDMMSIAGSRTNAESCSDYKWDEVSWDEIQVVEEMKSNRPPEPQLTQIWPLDIDK